MDGVGEKVALRKKTDVLMEMIARVWRNRMNTSFVLFESWFSHDNVLAQILHIGYGVICRLKKGKVKYSCQNQKYTLKQLWDVVKKKTQWLGTS